MTIALAALAAVSLGACDKVYFLLDTPTIQHAEAKVAHDLKYSSSAQFRDIKVYHLTDVVNVCGDVNGLGAYEGLVPVYYESSTN